MKRAMKKKEKKEEQKTAPPPPPPPPPQAPAQHPLSAKKQKKNKREARMAARSAVPGVLELEKKRSDPLKRTRASKENEVLTEEHIAKLKEAMGGLYLRNVPDLSYKENEVLTEEHIAKLKEAMGGLYLRNVPDLSYIELMKKALATKPSKFKEKIINAKDQRYARVKFENGLLYVNGGLVVPVSLSSHEPGFFDGLSLEAQKSVIVRDVTESIVEGHTGNHYRNHYFKAEDPYGHH